MNRLAWILPAFVLAACGSGGGTGADTTPAADTAPSITAITPGTVMYGKASTFTVTGTNLDQGIAVSAKGVCTSLSDVGGGTATSRTYKCTPSAVGTIRLTVSPATGGTALQTLSVTVPQPQVTIATSLGTIVVELDPTHAPITVKNFLQYVNSGFYSGTIFHRVVSGFVIQGGGYDASMTLKTTLAPIVLEAPSTTTLSNTQWTIAMARTSTADSATSQFYINTVDNPSLDTTSGGYAVFGKTTQGFDVVQAIEAVPVDSSSVPTSTVTITSAAQTL